MRRTRTPWSAKLRPEMKPEVATDPRRGDRLLLPTPLSLAAEITMVGSGSLLTASALRERLACRFQADRTCPLMAGIFFNILAGTVEDQLAAGQPILAPYWRIVRDDGSLSPKSPPGPARQAERLRAEGHRITRRGGLFRVAGFEGKTARRATCG